MIENIVEDWVAALRSGNYKQGNSWLRVNDLYCCLGVLCDLVNPRAWERQHNDIIFYHGGKQCFPDSDIYDAIATASGVSYGRIDSLFKELSDLNDEEGLTFNEIADVIERELLQ